MSSIGLVAIQSVVFPNAFLRVDGGSVTQTASAGSGTVNCQYYDQSNGANYPIPTFGNAEVFELIPLPGGVSWSYAIRSLFRPQAFLRMDGSNVTFQSGGSGTVNGQYYSDDYPQTNSGDYEHFLISPTILATESHPNYYSIASGAFPGVFLRIDGFDVTDFEGTGSGTVNCQYYSPGNSPSSTDDYEVFNIIYLTPPAAVGP